MIEVEGLRKTYEDLVAVDTVSFTARPGQIFGLLGPNGAGKSTTLGCICGLLTPSGGTVRVLGHDVVRQSVESRRSLGVVPQELALYEDLSARENLGFWGSTYGLRGAELKGRVAEVLDVVGLADRAGDAVKKFSGGMKRRLNFAAAVVHRPKVLLLDEPTVGVDPQSRVKLLDLVREQVAGGATVLYTTHHMEEAAELCDHLAIVDHGKVIAAGSLDELRGMLGERDVVRLEGSFEDDRLRAALAALDGVELVQLEGSLCRLAVEEAPRRLGELLAVLAENGAEVRETTVTRPSLESLFIKLTGRELRE